MKIKMNFSNRASSLLKLVLFLALISSSFTLQKLKNRKLKDLIAELNASKTLELIKSNKNTNEIVKQALKESESVKAFVVFSLIEYNLFLALISFVDPEYKNSKLTEKFDFNSEHMLNLLNLQDKTANNRFVFALNGLKEQFATIYEDKKLKEVIKNFVVEKIKKFNSNLKWSEKIKQAKNVKITDITMSNSITSEISRDFRIGFNTQIKEIKDKFVSFANEIRSFIFP